MIYSFFQEHVVSNYEIEINLNLIKLYCVLGGIRKRLWNKVILVLKSKIYNNFLK